MPRLASFNKLPLRISNIFLSFLILFIITFLPLNVAASVFYVRTDGSNSTNCTGQANSAYDGSGTGEACAYSHPFYWTGWWGDGSISSGGVAPSYAGGDDLIISCNDSGDCTGVTFNVGYDPSWTDMNSSWSYGGFMRPIKDGTSGNHTTIKGCSSSGCSNPSMRPGFTGMGRNKMNINLQSSDYVDIEDIDVYDTATCGVGHALYNCGSADAAEASVLNNINITGATNISLKNMKIYGAYSYGVFGGGGSNITFDNTDISYNSLAGWDADSCFSDGTCGLTGTITFQNGSKVNNNGCVMPSSLGTIASEGCYSQDQTGYGDGIGTNDTGGDWVFTDIEMKNNTSDGLDLLYHNRGSYSGGTIVIKRSVFEGNAGNQIKVSNALHLEDSKIIGNCGYHYGKSFTCTSGTCGHAFNTCRAGGNSIAIEFKSGDSTIPELFSNTITSNGDVGLQTSGTCTSGLDILDSNNIWIGGREFNDDTGINGGGGNDTSSIFYNSCQSAGDCGGPVCLADRVETNNICYGWKETTNACNGTSSIDGTSIPSDLFTGTILQGPQSSPGYYTSDNYSEQLSLHANATARGVSDEGVNADNLDINSFDRGAEWDAGAVEYGSTPGEGGGGGDPTASGSFSGSVRMSGGLRL